ncbi:glycoside hydrolase family 16 protein [Methylobacterium oxalidis]|uniref:glycoside hydrolase family 16 protein n=1 Tax=Methylobacterium oxalidis TaxID=944322 RepID=UPI003315A696
MFAIPTRLSVLLILCAAAGPAAAAENTLELCRFTRTFNEDFDSLSVSPWNAEKARWIAHTPWNGDFGDARFLDPGVNGPFFVKDGILTIEARKHPGDKWTSGLLASADPTTAGFSQTYGYFETRMKMPPGPGVWPAFWLAASARKTDQTPAVEIDVIEYYGQFPDAYHSVVHVWGKGDKPGHRATDTITKVPSGSLTEDFHTYGVEVTRESIVFYLDRREVQRVPTPPEHDKPLMLLVNLALGSGWPIDQTPNPSHLLVDYVRAYALKDGGDPSCRD